MNIPYVFKRCNKCGEWLVVCKINFHKDKSKKYGFTNQCKICRKQYLQKNKEYYKEYRKKYYQNNKEYYSEKHKRYYQNNKEKISEYYKQWKECNEGYFTEWHKQYYSKTREQQIEYSKQYRKLNKKKIIEYNKQYKEINKERLIKYSKQYYQMPQGQTSAFNGRVKRRTREQNQGNGITKEQWVEMMKYFNWECAYSDEYIGGNENLFVRSIDHIIPLAKGGKHEIWNLVPMYRSYNSSKQDKDMIIWYKQQDFYSEERLQKIYEWQEYAYNKWSCNIIDVEEA